MRFKLLISFYLIFLFSLNAQTKEITPLGIMTDRSLSPERLTQMQWAKWGNHFFYTKNDSLFAVGLKGKVENVLTLKDINYVLITHKYSELNRFPNINVLNDSIFIFTKDSFLLSFNYKDKLVRSENIFISDAENIDFEFNNLNIAYTKDNNLFVSVKNRIIPISISKDRGIVYGQSVHRDEFGIVKGTFWSPEGNYLTFYRMDETMVADYPLVEIEDPISQCRMIKYPMAGTTNHVVTVGIYSVKNDSVYYLQAKHWDDQYLTNISWSPDEKYIYMAVLKRNQKEMKLSKYNVSDGSFIKTIFTEKNDKYVEPLKPLCFLDKNGEDFIWQSQRDGYNHLYQYNAVSGDCKQLTEGNWVVNEILRFDNKKNILYIIASKEHPIERELYALNINNKTIKKLSIVSGINSALLSYDCSLIVSSVSNTEISNRITLIDNKGKEICTLLKENPKLRDYLSDIEIFTIKSKDNKTDLYCRILKAKNLDLSKKHPVIVYVYGGPHSQMISNTWTGGAGLYLHYLANKGYVIFTLDNRGSANRGLEFEQAIYKHVGEVEVEDQMQGIKYLQGLNYIDTSRIGVHGWSYGGFLAIQMMLKHSDIFKVGVAGGPVCDWKYYEIMYGERYMSTPNENPEGYYNSSLINHIEELQGKLLIIHGDNDHTVLWQHSLMLLKRAIQKKVLLDYFVYPGHEHNVQGVDRAHMMRKIETYFNDFL